MIAGMASREDCPSDEIVIRLLKLAPINRPVERQSEIP